MRTAVLVLVAVLTGSGQGLAQPLPPGDFRSSASCVIGGGRTWDDEGQIGDGALLGVRAERRLFGGTSVELSLDTLRHSREGGFTAKGRTLLAGGAIVQRFGRARTQPYVLGGITLAHHRGTFGFPADSLTNRAENTDLGLMFGGGVSVRIGRRFEVGPEARFLLLSSDNDSAPAFADWLGARIGVRF